VYTWIWRRLPGGLPGKVAGSLLLLTVAVLLLFFVVFPAVEPLLPVGDVTVETESRSALDLGREEPPPGPVFPPL
jgi:hypothetical protein